MDKHDLRLNGKVTVITGVAGGIGQALARLFARHGSVLVLTDVRKHAWDKLRSSINARGAEMLLVKHDVRDPKSWRSLVDKVIKSGKER